MHGYASIARWSSQKADKVAYMRHCMKAYSAAHKHVKGGASSTDKVLTASSGGFKSAFSEAEKLAEGAMDVSSSAASMTPGHTTASAKHAVSTGTSHGKINAKALGTAKTVLGDIGQVALKMLL